MTITTIAFDGDDTLWHHENYFNSAKERFRTFINRFDNIPDAGDRLDTQHILDLAVWGYGVKGFTLTMIDLAVKMVGSKMTPYDVQEVLAIGRDLYQHPVQLLDHVAETIGALHDRYRLLLITKGDLVAQEMKVAKSGLGKFFDGIEIVSEKNIDTYRRIFDRYQIVPKELIMIGNSIRSDIIPPIRLGAQAIHVPYHTSWHFEKAELAETDQEQFLVLPSMKDVVPTLEKLEQSGQSCLQAIVDKPQFCPLASEYK
jgi:putative hydrolase of the HAD superfamily